MDFNVMRQRMADTQLTRRGIKDPKVINAMRAVPRHAFVPDQIKDMAYEDRALPIGEGQTISQPYIVALMTESLALDQEKTVLEIGAGSGYQAAVLAALAKEVYALERIEILAQRARTLLKDLGYQNVHVLAGDGSGGFPDGDRTFDAILIAAASPEPPRHLFAQLKADGRLVVPVGGRDNQDLMLYHKTEDGIKEKKICACVFVPLLGKYGWTS